MRAASDWLQTGLCWKKPHLWIEPRQRSLKNLVHTCVEIHKQIIIYLCSIGVYLWIVLRAFMSLCVFICNYWDWSDPTHVLLISQIWTWHISWSLLLCHSSSHSGRSCVRTAEKQHGGPCVSIWAEMCVAWRRVMLCLQFSPLSTPCCPCLVCRGHKLWRTEALKVVIITNKITDCLCNRIPLYNIYQYPSLVARITKGKDRGPLRS